MSDDVRTLFSRLNDVARALGERRDCAVKAVAAATGRAYVEVHALLKAAGRHDRRGTKVFVYRGALKTLGFKTYDVQIPPCTRRTVTDHLRPVGTYLVRTVDHVFCVKDGVQVDFHGWTRRLQRVKEVFAVVPDGTDPTPLLACAAPRKLAASKARGKNLGIGEYMRARLKYGDAPRVIAENVRARYPGSTATVKDVYMVRRKMRSAT